ncbi:MAG: PorT family protein [Sphingobacteriaceae bacterium]|nr:PorT family protein [Sphingobacteriaceae bacterium]
MKKILIIASLFSITTTIAVAQDSSNETDNREKFQFGLKAGLNYSNVYDEQGEDFEADAKFGFVGGLFMAIPIGKYLGVQPEILISQKGFRGHGVILGNPYSFNRTTTYIDVPLQFMLKPSEFFTILVGPQFSYLMNQRDVFTSSSNSYAQEQEFKQDNIRKNVFGVVGGFDINLRHITLGARAACDLQTNAGDGTSSTPRYKNVWLQGTVGYKFYK